MPLEPAAARFQIENTSDGIRAVIPAKRSWIAMLFLAAWLGGWVMGETSAIGELLHPKDTGSIAFLAFWLVGWTIGGVFAAWTILWQMAGKEIITIGTTTLAHRVEIFGVGRTREFRIADVTHIRATEYSAQTATNQGAWFPPVAGSGFGALAFDYGARTFRLAPSLEEAEAKMLVRELAARLPKKINQLDEA